MSYHGRFEEQKPPKPPKKKMKKGKKIFLIVLAVLVVLIAGVVIAGVSYYNKMMSKMNIIVLPEDTYVYTEETTEPIQTETGVATEESAVDETTEAVMTAEDIINILVVGQSARYGEESHLADTTMVVSVNTFTKEITVLSVLRDTYVDLPDYKGHSCGWAKFNVCYNLGYNWGGIAGAMEMTNICLRNNFGIEIDYNVEVDFDGFIRVIDYVGGVKLDLTQAEADYLNADDLYVLYDVEPGVQYLDGMAALSYARMRKAEGDSDSDIKRTSRQRYLIKCLLNNIRSSSLTQIQSIINEVLPLIATTMTSDEMMDLLFKLVPMLPDLVVEGGTCPVEGTYWSDLKETPDGEFYVLCFAADQQKKLMRAITEAEGLDTAAAAAN